MNGRHPNLRSTRPPVIVVAQDELSFDRLVLAGCTINLHSRPRSPCCSVVADASFTWRVALATPARGRDIALDREARRWQPAHSGSEGASGAQSTPWCKRPRTARGVFQDPLGVARASAHNGPFTMSEGGEEGAAREGRGRATGLGLRTSGTGTAARRAGSTSIPSVARSDLR